MNIRLALCAFLLAASCGGSEKPAVEAPEGAAEEGAGSEARAGEHRSTVPDIDDDDDDGGMEVRGLRGRLELADIKAGLAPHQEDFVDCHRSRTKRRRYIGGQLKLAVDVSKDGLVKQVRLIESDLGAWDIEHCILEIARTMKFAKPHGGADTDFTVPMDLGARSNVLWWPEEKADTEVADKLPELAECQDSPSDVWVTLYVGTRGEVKSVGFASQDKTPISDEWAQCASETIESWKLSDPRGRVAKTGFRLVPE